MNHGLPGIIQNPLLQKTSYEAFLTRVGGAHRKMLLERSTGFQFLHNLLRYPLANRLAGTFARSYHLASRAISGHRFLAGGRPRLKIYLHLAARVINLRGHALGKH